LSISPNGQFGIIAVFTVYFTFSLSLSKIYGLIPAGAGLASASARGIRQDRPQCAHAGGLAGIVHKKKG
jgi:hypothetical protein